jgi:two-component system, sensor histidine kinase and response regulator
MQTAKYSILYVDDEEANLNVFKAAYKWDYRIFTAVSAAQGLAIMEANPIDLVISDQRMPDMDGVDFLKLITPKYPNTVKILLTGYSEPEVIITAINECGIYRYMTKPWDDTEMRLSLQKALETYSLKLRNEQLIKALQEAKAELEQRVEERTAEVRRQNEEIAQQKEEITANYELLVEAMREKNGIIGVVAHDLQAPLRRIGGLVELIKLTDSSEERVTYFGLLQKETSQGIRLVQNILYAEKLEELHEELVVEPVDLAQITKAVVQKYETLAAKKNITILVEQANGAIWASASADYLSRVLDNLVSNAVKFSPENRMSQISVRLGKEADKAKIQVQDQGPGFSEDDKKKMFKRFQKLSAQPTGGESSTGLGLSIIKTLVDKMNGDVMVESEPDQGAIFTVLLPAAQV